MKLPKWGLNVNWLKDFNDKNNSVHVLFEKYMLPNILMKEDESKYLIFNVLTPYFEKHTDYEVSSLIACMLIEVDLYFMGGDGQIRDEINKTRIKLNKAATLANELAIIMGEIKALEETMIFAIPSSLESILEKHGYELSPINPDYSLGPHKKEIDTESLLLSIADDLSATPVGVPNFEWLDHYQKRIDPLNIILHSLKVDSDPPDNVVAALITLCFGKETDPQTVQRQNSPSRQKNFKKFSDVRRIKF